MLKTIPQLDGNDSFSNTDSQTDQNKTNQVNNLFQNIRSNINSLKGKKEESKSVIDRHNPDSIILVETKLNDSYKNSEFFDLNKWNIVVRGGIIIAVLRKYIATPIEIKYENGNNPELYWIKLHTVKIKNQFIFVGYIDPKETHIVLKQLIA